MAAASDPPAAASRHPVTETSNDTSGPEEVFASQPTSDDREAFRCEWSRFQRLYERRRALFLSESHQRAKATSRVFIISRNDDPWNCFGLTTRLEFCRRVFEVSALHFSELHDACATGDRKRVRAILHSPRSEQHGCTLSRDSCVRIPLHHAVVREHHRVVRLLLQQHDSRLQLHSRDNRNATPVNYVLEKIHRIGSKLGATLAKQTKRLRETHRRYRRLWRLADSMLATMNAGFVKELQALDFRARGDAWDAVRTGDVERLRQIWTLYGDIRDFQLDQLGTTLLHEACSGSPRHLDVVLFLVSEVRVDRRAVDQQGATPLHYAAMRGWLEACVLLLDSDDQQFDADELLMMRDARGRTPLHAALYAVGRSRHQDDVSCGAVATARYLVQQCADALHVVDLDGFTPLHYAICAGDSALVQLLVDLGAAVLCDEPPSLVLSTSGFGVKAPWAPCGQIFSRMRKPQRPDQVSEQPNGEDVPAFIPVVAELSEARSSATESSKACERLRKVKEGLVEHPGVAIPMETLWFWVHTKPQMSPKTQRDDTIRPTGRLLDVSTQAEVGDPQTHGCRRFGAVCSSCAVVPGQVEAESSCLPHVVAVLVPPLLLAIRCCRQARNSPPSRRAIVEILLHAGASAGEAALEEALRSPPSLEVQELLLAHSTMDVTPEWILRHFGFKREAIGDTNDRESSLLLMLEKVDADGLVSLLPTLFNRRYFRVVEQFLDRTEEATLAELVHAICSPASTSETSKSSVTQQLTADHLECVTRWIGLWPNHARDLAAVAVVSVSNMLKSTALLTSKVHREADSVLSASLEVLAIHAHEELHTSATEWTARALEKGYPTTVHRLWRVLVADSKLAVALVSRVAWPLRSADAAMANTLRGLLPTLIEAVSNHSQTEDSEFQLGGTVLSQCLAIACAYDMREQLLQRLLTSITSFNCDDQAAELVLSQRFTGLLLIDDVARRDRVDIAERLWTELKITDTVRERLWAALVKARLCFWNIEPRSNADRWQQLLFTPVPSCVSSSTVKDLVLKTLVRVAQPCSATTKALLRVFLQPHELTDPTATPLPLLFLATARFNAIDVAKLTIEAWEATDTRLPWSRIVTTRDDLDRYSPIEICELLGHHDLARYFRGLVAEADLPTPSSAWLPVNHRRLGLLRTTMALPTSSPAPPSTILSSRVHSKLDPTAIWTGDLHTAVAYNDVRALQAFHLHDLPLQPSHPDASSDDLASISCLLDTAIQFGSDDALQWLLLTFASPISQLGPETSSLLVHKAARHTSALFARLTLRLLRHAGVSPGRLRGDGTDCTLLHRVACFADSPLAVEALEWLLQRDACDVNVRDGFGSTPVMYALASGRLETACWLLSRCSHARLEAEYEGQSLFYYALHLLPSFAWRCVVQPLLTARRQAAFLHCEADDCACKGCEVSASEAESNDGSCAFCGHSVASHTRVPYPPWFRDQYETYELHTDTAIDNHDEEADDEDDEEAAALRRQRALLERPLADESTLEADRGRLRIPALLRVTQLRFQALLTQYALSIPLVEDAAVVSSSEEDEELVEETGALSADSGTNLADTNARHLVRTLAHPSVSLAAVVEPPFPCFLRGDAAMVLAHEACCPTSWHDVTSVSAKTQIVLAKWFRHSNRQGPEPIFVPSDRVSTLRAALARWQRREGTTTADPAASTSASWVATLHGHTSNQCPVAPGTPNPTEQNKLEERSTTSMNPSDHACDVIGPPCGSTSNANTNRCVSILQLFVHHWRYARVYQGFRQWKRLMVNAQVAHHELETLADTWSAGDRRVKLQGLVAKQRAVEEEIRRQGLVESGEVVQPI